MDLYLITREATTEDIPTIVRHRRLMFESMGFTDKAANDAMDASVTAYLTEAIPEGKYLGGLVATRDGRAVAGAGLTVVQLPGKPYNPSGRYAYLMSLYVEPEFRRQGIARGLIEAMIEWSRDHGITEVRLHASNQGQPMYEQLGFVQTNEMRLLLEDR